MEISVKEIRDVLSKTSAKELAFLINENDSMREQGIDSLDLMDLYLNIEDKYGIQIPDADVAKLKSLKDFVDYVNSKIE